jgi:hypothetical protein
MPPRPLLLIGTLLTALLAGWFLSRLPQASRTKVPAIDLKQVTDIEEEDPRTGQQADDGERQGQDGAQQGPLPKPAPAGNVSGAGDEIGGGSGATTDTDDDRATGNSGDGTASDDPDEDEGTDDQNTNARGTDVPDIDDGEADGRGLGNPLEDDD